MLALGNVCPELAFVKILKISPGSRQRDSCNVEDVFEAPCEAGKRRRCFTFSLCFYESRGWFVVALEPRNREDFSCEKGKRLLARETRMKNGKWARVGWFSIIRNEKAITVCESLSDTAPHLTRGSFESSADRYDRENQPPNSLVAPASSSLAPSPFFQSRNETTRLTLRRARRAADAAATPRARVLASTLPFPFFFSFFRIIQLREIASESNFFHFLAHPPIVRAHPRSEFFYGLRNIIFFLPTGMETRTLRFYCNGISIVFLDFFGIFEIFLFWGKKKRGRFDIITRFWYVTVNFPGSILNSVGWAKRNRFNGFNFFQVFLKFYSILIVIFFPVFLKFDLILEKISFRGVKLAQISRLSLNFSGYLWFRNLNSIRGPRRNFREENWIFFGHFRILLNFRKIFIPQRKNWAKFKIVSQVFPLLTTSVSSQLEFCPAANGNWSGGRDPKTNFWWLSCTRRTTMLNGRTQMCRDKWALMHMHTARVLPAACRQKIKARMALSLGLSCYN